MSRLRKYRNWFKSPRKKYLLLGSVGVVVTLIGLELTNTTYIFHKQSIPPVIPTQSSSNNEGSIDSAKPNDDTQNNSSSSNDKSPSGSSGNSHAQNLPLQSPYGNFVSNHRPGENGVPTNEASVCNTTPGATCYIRFTKGSTTTSLPSKKTNSDGAAYWYWDIKDAKLTAGEWKITAVAELNGQTKSADDPLPLTVN